MMIFNLLVCLFFILRKVCSDNRCKQKWVKNIEIATETNKQIHRHETTRKARFNDKMTRSHAISSCHF